MKKTRYKRFYLFFQRLLHLWMLVWCCWCMYLKLVGFENIA